MTHLRTCIPTQHVIHTEGGMIYTHTEFNFSSVSLSLVPRSSSVYFVAFASGCYAVGARFPRLKLDYIHISSLRSHPQPCRPTFSLKKKNYRGGMFEAAVSVPAAPSLSSPSLVLFHSWLFFLIFPMLFTLSPFPFLLLLIIITVTLPSHPGVLIPVLIILCFLQTFSFFFYWRFYSL